MMHAALLLTSMLVAPQSNPYPPQYQAPGFGAAAVTELKPAWTMSPPGPIQSASMAPDGSCVALVTPSPAPGRVMLVDRNGQRAWDFAPPAPLRTVAVAPGCAWVAFDATRESDHRPASGGGSLVDRGRVGIRHRDGAIVELAIDGSPDAMAASPSGDLLAIGSDCPEGRNSVTLASPGGRVVAALPRHSYRAPQLTFSRDGQFIVVTGWYGVGVMTRDGRPVWGPFPLGGAPARKADWRRVEASRDLKWFAAEVGPMHGPDGGSCAILSASGEVVWQGPQVWGADARIAPDGSYVVTVGLEIRSSSLVEDDGTKPVGVAVIDRSGRVLASRRVPRPTLQGITDDGRYILMRETDASGRSWLVGRDPSLAVGWRMPVGVESLVSLEGGWVITWAGGRVAAFTIPR